MEEQTKRPGFVSSKHIFGKSSIVRDGNRLYYLKWQWDDNKTHSEIINLTPKQYNEIKVMLLGVREEKVFEVTPIASAIVYTHRTNAKTYMRIKRYLIKNKLLKKG